MDPTPRVTVDLPGALRAYCGGSGQVPVAAGTVAEVLAGLEREWPALHRNVCDEQGAVRKHLNVFVNIDNIRDREGLDTVLQHGDIVTILPAVSGGEIWQTES